MPKRDNSFGILGRLIDREGKIIEAVNNYDELYDEVAELRQEVQSLEGRGGGGGDTTIVTNSTNTTVGEDGEFESLENAYDETADNGGGHVEILPSYDADNDSFPIDVHSRVTGIVGQGQASTIDARGVSSPVLKLNYRHVRPMGPTFRNFRIRGGENGVLVEHARYSDWSNVMLRDQTDDALKFKGNDEGAINTHNFRSCKMEGAGGAGIGMYQSRSYQPHGVRLFQTDINFCERGIVHEGGFSVDVHQGSIQHMDHEAILSDSPGMMSVYGVYIEANCESGSDTEVHLKRSNGSTIRDCYFNPLGNSTEHAIVNESTYVTVEDCSFRQYPEAIVDNGSNSNIRPDTCRRVGSGGRFSLGNF